MPEADPRLEQVLAEAAALGFFGPGSIHLAIEHAGGFGAVLRPCGRVLDLGSGGGLPGLVLAMQFPALAVVLLDASERRTDVLRRSVGRLELGDRVEVVCRRAEVLGREASWRGTLDAVVARGFGKPALAAECAAPLLALGGQLVVSEPPATAAGRWPAEPLAELGLVRDDALTNPRYASFTQFEHCPGRFPRRSLRKPLF